MSEAIVGRATARFQQGSYGAAAPAIPRPAASFPGWIKALFIGGLFVLVGSLVGLMLTPILGSSASVTALFATAAAGIGALWIVAKVAPRYDAGR